MQPVATFALVFFLRVQYSIGAVTDNIFADKCLSFNLNSKTCLKSYAKFIKKRIQIAYQLLDMNKQVSERRNVACHESTTLMVDNNHPDIPSTSCKMGQIAPNFEVLNQNQLAK